MIQAAPNPKTFDTPGWRRFRELLEADWRPAKVQQQHPLIQHPELLFKAMGPTWAPDPWQLKVIAGSAAQQLVCIPRQCGKSLVAAAKATIIVLTRPKALVSIISRSQDQASEVLRKVKDFHAAYQEERTSGGARPWEPKPVRMIEAAQREADAQATATVTNSVMTMELGNGGRIRSMPCSANTTVGYTNDLLILDEASRIPDAVYFPLRPTLAKARSVGKGQLLVMSTPNGKRGWFWEAWRDCIEAEEKGEQPDWDRTTIRVEECPRISKNFLDGELRGMGSLWYNQEYNCVFGDAIGAVFREEDIKRAMRTVDDLPVLEEDV